ncbi:hypothetical protein KC660_04920 [Candidatus Dojkabacteria bacterium]|uniref:Uncharacterized protein n=1 Tax=Candidatus Dojkabacteria bacterium TaxID=2099670 RepID=A0A955L4B4_9BACT|nr:hypothetical protein [Candidatus Dojkabacteria bacterium]
MKVRKSLSKILKSDEIAAVLKQNETNLQSEAKNLKDVTAHSPEYNMQTYSIIRDNCSFVHKLFVDVHKSIALFADAIRANKYHTVDRLLDIRSHEMSEA